MADRTIRVKVDADVQGLKALEKAGKKMQDAGTKLSLGITLPLVAAGVAAFKLASDVDEATSKVETVYGKSAAKIVTAAQSMTDAMSEAEFLDIAGTFGAILKNMGLTEQVAATLSTQWISLAQDMGSFHNVDPTAALQAIQSAIAGEFEPLKQFGVLLNAATVEQKALELGVWAGTGALSEAARVQAINALLYEQQKDVVGDFARTQDGAANSTRIATKNLIDSAAALGEELIPIGLEAIAFVSDLIKQFKDLPPETRKTIVQIGLVAAAIGPLLVIGGSLIGMFGNLIGIIKVVAVVIGALASPIALLALAVAAAIALIALNFDAFMLGIRTVLRFIKRVVREVVEFVGNIFGAIGDAFTEAWDAFRRGWNLFARFWNSLSITVPPILLPPPIGLVPGFTVDLPNLPVLDAGAIVTGPTLAMLAANNRPEAVIPLDQMGGSVTVYIETGVGDPVAIGRELVRVLDTYTRSAGPLPLSIRP